MTSKMLPILARPMERIANLGMIILSHNLWMFEPF